MINPRRRICLTIAESLSPRARRADSERYVVMPTMNRKNGKMRSVGVQPFHSACSSGGKIALQVPGSLTSSIPATVIPRKTSSESRRSEDPRGAAAVLIRSPRLRDCRCLTIYERPTHHVTGQSPARRKRGRRGGRPPPLAEETSRRDARLRIASADEACPYACRAPRCCAALRWRRDGE